MPHVLGDDGARGPGARAARSRARPARRARPNALPVHLLRPAMFVSARGQELGPVARAEGAEARHGGTFSMGR